MYLLLHSHEYGLDGSITRILIYTEFPRPSIKNEIVRIRFNVRDYVNVEIIIFPLNI